MSPWATEINVEGRWIRNRAQLRFIEDGNTLQQIEIPWWQWWRDSKYDLWNAEVGKRLRQLDKSTEIGRYLGELVAPHEPPTVISGDATADIIPWEAFEEFFSLPSRAERYAPVRIVGSMGPWDASRFDEPMRVAFLVGHEGPSSDFDRTKLKATLRANLASMDVENGGRIAPSAEVPILDLAEQPLDALLDTLAAHKPHVVFYFGHGRGGQSAGIRIGAGKHDWLEIETLAAKLRSRGSLPPFWIFAACSLGDSSEQFLLPGPTTFSALRKHGALAVLAMRAKVRVDLAELVVKAVLERMAIGDSLEIAAAAARRAIRASRHMLPDLWDWASPAVWSAAQPGTRVQWGDGSNRQPNAWLSAHLLRKTALDPALGLEVPSGWAQQVATRWRSTGRVRLHVENTSTSDAGAREAPGLIARLAEILIADRRLKGLPILLVKATNTQTVYSESYSNWLADWAAEQRAGLTPSLAELELARALERIERQKDIEGLKQLLALPGLLIVFHKVPGRGVQDRAAWEEIVQAPCTATIVVCEQQGKGSELTQGWTLDTVEGEMGEAAVEVLLRTHPKTAGLLAVIDRPVHPQSLVQATGEPVLESPLLIREAASGVVLADGARQAVRSRLGAAGIAGAHRHYVEKTQAGIRFGVRDPLAYLSHLAGAGLTLDLAASAEELARSAGNDWTVGDWQRFAGPLETNTDARRALDPQIALRIGQILVERQELDRAASWLEELTTTSIDDEIVRCLQLSEVWKAKPGEAAKKQMWHFARRALEECRALASPSPGTATQLLPHVELSWARLQLYFEHDARDARSTFENLIEKWSDKAQDNEAVARIVVAAKRNLAECLFEFEPFKTNADRALADTYLQEATSLAETRGFSHLAAEVTYSRAKLAEAEGQQEVAIDLLDQCSQQASESGHALMSSIATLRRFWVGVRGLGASFDLASYKVRQRPLDYFAGHGWALRYGGQSRLWAARRLMDRGERDEAQAALQDNLETLGPLAEDPGLSDKALIARSYAGISVASASAESAWSTFLSLPWAAAWLAEKTLSGPQAVWAEVT